MIHPPSFMKIQSLLNWPQMTPDDLEMTFKMLKTKWDLNSTNFCLQRIHVAFYTFFGQWPQMTPNLLGHICCSTQGSLCTHPIEMGNSKVCNFTFLSKWHTYLISLLKLTQCWHFKYILLLSLCCNTFFPTIDNCRYNYFWPLGSALHNKWHHQKWK